MDTKDTEGSAGRGLEMNPIDAALAYAEATGRPLLRHSIEAQTIASAANLANGDLFMDGAARLLAAEVRRLREIEEAAICDYKANKHLTDGPVCSLHALWHVFNKSHNEVAERRAQGKEPNV